MEWDDDLDFERSALYGGAVELGFGRFVGLSGYYLTAGETSLFNDATAPDFDLERMGVRLSLALGTGVIVPVLSAGGSVFAFEPAGGEMVRRIGIDWGGGLRAGFGGGLSGELLVHQGLVRMEPNVLLGGDPDLTTDATLRRNLSLTAGLGFQLGRRPVRGVSELDAAFEERVRSPLSNLALTVEPMAGRLEWSDETGLPRQDMIGVRAGLDFGPFFGLRGFHWWGTEDDFHTTTGMRAWGGEAQFNLRAGRSITPYLTGGVARFTWDDSEPDAVFTAPADQDALVAGGGIEFNLGSLLRANVGVRDVILSGADLSTSADGLDTRLDPSSLVHSLQMVAGFQLRIGSSGISRAPRPSDDDPMPMRTSSAAAQDSASKTDSTSKTESADRAESTSETDSEAKTTRTGETDASASDRRVVQIPVPERGEIIIRYGEPGTDSAVTTRAMLGGDAPVSARLLEILDRLDRRLAAVESGDSLTDATGAPAAARDSVSGQVAQAGDPELRAFLEQINRRLAALESQRGERTVVSAPRTVVVETEDGASVERGLFEVRPWVGVGASSYEDRDGPQFLIGVSADLGRLSAGSPLRMVPEIAFGFGAGGSILANLGLVYTFPSFTVKDRVELEPQVGFGPALLKADRFSARVTTLLGTGIRILNEEGEQSANLFFALQGTDLFSDVRLQLGVRKMR